MTFATVAVAALALAAPATARPRRSSRSQPAPPTHVVDSGNVEEHTTSSSTSTASCSAEVKASTWSTAVSQFTDLIADITLDFCFASGYADFAKDKQQEDLKIKAIASLLLESKLECDAEGKYALACARSWAGAHSFAGASMEAYASAWADGSNRLSHCKCAVDVFAEADAVTSAWAEVWVKIYQGLDDTACAQTYDGTKDSIYKEQSIHCVGNQVLHYWVKAIAKVVSYGKCEPDEYLACETCCKNKEDPYGDYVSGCDVDDCKEKCRKSEAATLKATAEAAITGVATSSAICSYDLNVNYQQYWGTYQPDHFDPHVDYSGDAYAVCEATAHATSFARSASAQASLIKGIWESTCDVMSLASTGKADFDEKARAWANAYIDVLAEAHTECSAKGGDDEYDGGCARATAFSKAYASAQADAIAAAYVDYAYGKDNHCKCDIAVAVLTDAIAHEIETISVFYQTEVEARSCNHDNHGTPDISYIKQTCWASSLADMLAKSMATVALDGKCAPDGDSKTIFCEGKCKQYETYDADWTPCMAECEKESSATVTAAVDAVAKIKVNSKEYCDGHDGMRTGETYLTKLNGYVTPDISA